MYGYKFTLHINNAGGVDAMFGRVVNDFSSGSIHPNVGLRQPCSPRSQEMSSGETDELICIVNPRRYMSRASHSVEGKHLQRTG